MKLINNIAISVFVQLIGIYPCLHAQQVGNFVDSLINNKTIKIPVYQIQENNFSTKVFKMEFCKSNFIDTAGISLLNDAEILSINLVFTDYPASLDLKPLNRSRFIQLNKYLPNALKNKLTQWLIIRQMNGFDKNSAKDMLHGFVINYRLPITAKEWNKEIDYIRAVTPEPEPEPIPEVKKTPKKKEKVRNWDAIHNNRNIYNSLFDRFIKLISQNKSLIKEEFVKRDSVVTLATKDALRYKIISGKEDDLDFTKDSLYVLLDALPKKEEYLPVKIKPVVVLKTDSTFFRVISRNNFKRLLVVADVTSSMSRYNAQVIQWISRLTDNQFLNAFVCFNDGDGKQNELKEIGNTGGIYGEIYENAAQLGSLLERVMMKGSGGDLAENDCEALIKAIEMFDNYEDIVLIADSWAPVKDIQLVNKIRKPINIIICGNDLGPHPDYVYIAYATKGRLCFMDKDVTDFSALANNEVQNIKGTNYILKDGKVVYAVK